MATPEPAARSVSADPAAVLPDPGDGGVELTEPERVVLLVIAVAATLGFVAVRLIVALGGHQPLPMDEWWHGVTLATEQPLLIGVAWFPAVVGGTVGVIVIVLLLAGLFLWLRRPWDALHLAAATAVVVAIGAPMAAVIARVRPEDSLAEQVATSFPSGHTAVATTICLTLALILHRWYVWVAGVLWVVLMAWSRTYLHAHWLSDVLAGILEGLAVGAVVWCVIELGRDRRAARRERES